MWVRRVTAGVNAPSPWDPPTCQHCSADIYCEGDAPRYCDDCAALPKCSECDEPIPTGDDEPASGLCAGCEEREADYDAACSAAEDQAWRSRERADERREG